jgi:uncharacterized membrane protein
MHKLQSVKKIFLATAILNSALFLIFVFSNHYNVFTVVLNIISVFILLLSLISYNKLFKCVYDHRFDIAICFSLFIIGILLYTYKVDVVTPGMWGDEEAIARAGEKILTSPELLPFVPVNFGHATPLLYLEGFSLEFFGRTLLAIRLPSIVFGALSVACLYILLRLFFSKTMALSAAFLMLFSYPLIIISRLAYETTASIFFQILSVITLYLAWEKKDIRYFILAGIILGFGFYTYIGIRAFALTLFLMLTFVIIRSKRELLKQYFQYVLYFLGGLFIATVPILSYSLTHWNEIMSRTNSISVFNQNYPFGEIVKEIGFSIASLSYIFFFTGDPNPGHNPSNASMFEIMTGILFFVGLVFLFKKNKKIFLLTILLIVPSVINDVFSVEIIPGVHDYAVGHPNILRVAGIIPLVYFVIAATFESMKSKIESIGSGLYLTALIPLLLIIAFFNYYLYFNQPFNPWIYKNQRVIPTKIVSYINNSSAHTVLVSPSYLNDTLITYLLKPGIQLKAFNPKSSEEALAMINANEIIVIDPSYDKPLTNMLDSYVRTSTTIKTDPLLSPVNTVDAVALIPINFLR